MTTTGTRSRSDPRSQRTAWVVVGVSWSIYLVMQVTGFDGPLRTVAKGFLMPTLLAWVLVALGSRAPRWLVAGLAFATLGDVLLDIWFEVGMVGFLVMQLCYITGFLRLGAWAGLRARWPVAIAYLLVGVGANVALWPHLADLPSRSSSTARPSSRWQPWPPGWPSASVWAVPSSSSPTP